MRYSIGKITLLLFLAAAILGGLGCAGKAPEPLGKEYRETMNRQKRIAMAKQEEERTKETPGMTASGYETLGDQYLRQGNRDFAFVQYAKSLQLKPDQPGIRYKMGGLFLQKGLYEEARKEFEEVRKAHPQHALACEGIGKTWFYARHDQEAERHFREALRLDRTLWQAHNFLGIIYGQRKEFDRAIREYEMAIALNPDAPMLFNNLGMALVLKGEPEQAVRAFTNALRLKNADRRIYSNLGFALAKSGRFQEAVEAFRKGGNEASALHYLGLVRETAEKKPLPLETAETSEKRTETEPACYFAAHRSLRRTNAAALLQQK